MTGPAGITLIDVDERLGTVDAALSTVLDPELDRPITELGFVRGVSVHESVVEVRLRLPTYFCAPNFAWLMVEDAHRVLARLEWASEVRVVLEDHFASEEINRGVADRRGFADAFPQLADPDQLEELRRTFLRKGHQAAQGRLGKRLLARGWTLDQMAMARLRDLPPKTSLPFVRRRKALGLPADDDAPVFTDDEGRPVPAAAIECHLRRARTVGVGITANTEICEGLLATRYRKEDGTAGESSDAGRSTP